MRSIILVAFIVSSSACSSSSPPVGPDGPPSTVPDNPAGVFAVATSLDIIPPPSAASVIDALDRAAANPGQFLLERMLDTVPDGTTKRVAELAVPYVAAYLDVKLAELCPRFLPGVQLIASGFARVSSHVELLESWRIDDAGNAVRSVGAVQYDLGGGGVIAFADQGLADVTALAGVALDAEGHLSIAEHAVSLRYGALVRGALDLAVVPTVAPGSHDVASALSSLVDCPRLGAAVADRVGIGPASFYANACVAAMVHFASELDAHVVAIDANPLVIDARGAAVGLDLDHDGTMDEVRSGRWQGIASFASASQAITAGFSGIEGP